MKFKSLFVALAFALMFFSLATPAKAAHTEVRFDAFGVPRAVVVPDAADVLFNPFVTNPFLVTTRTVVDPFGFTVNPFLVRTAVFNPFLVRTAVFNPFIGERFVRREFVGRVPARVVERRVVRVRR